MRRDCQRCEFNVIDEYLLPDGDEMVETRCMHEGARLPYPDNVLLNFTAAPPDWCPLGAEDDEDDD